MTPQPPDRAAACGAGGGGLGSPVLDVAAADARRRAAERLREATPALDPVVLRFVAAGRELALVGGWVRDALLDRPTADFDLATDARPGQTRALLEPVAEAVWEVGAAYGTIGARVSGHTVEVTTYRAEAYGRHSRKPAVSYGESLEDDLGRRDFTVNAIALRLPEGGLVDPYGGLGDLARGLLRTPGRPEDSFSDDPLRMLRAARFAAQLRLTVAPDVVAAMTSMAERLSIVSAERVREELSRLLLGVDPVRGLRLLVDTGLADHVLSELPALRLEIDEHHRHKDVYEHTLTVLDQVIGLEARLPGGGPDLVVRLAALLHDIGKPRTRRHEPGGGVTFHHHDVVGAKLARSRLAALRYPKDVVEAVSGLVGLHLRFHGYGGGEWTDAAVRRYVRDAGDLLPRLHVLTRADCTTRNRRRAAALRRSYDDLEARIERLAAAEELAAIRPDLDGRQIMAELSVPPGPVVGRAYRHLLELRLDRGPLDEATARAELRRWWAAQPEPAQDPPGAPGP